MICVLDIDDTLYLERDYVHSGFRAIEDWAQGRFGVTGLGDRCRALHEAGHRGKIFNQALLELELPPDDATVTEAVDIYRGHAPDIHLLPDARRLLEELAGDTAWSLAAISDGPLRSQQRKAEALELDRWIPTILLTDEWGRGYWKPHPRAFLEVERVYSTPPEKCVYVADNPLKDFHAPLERGWKTIRVRRRDGIHFHHASLPEFTPHAEIASLPGLHSLPVDML